MVDLRSYQPNVSASASGFMPNQASAVINDGSFQAMAGAAKGLLDQTLGIDKKSLENLERQKSAERDLRIRKDAMDMDVSLKQKLSDAEFNLQPDQDIADVGFGLIGEDYTNNPMYKNYNSEDLTVLKQHRLSYTNNNYQGILKKSTVNRSQRTKAYAEALIENANTYVNGTNEGLEQALVAISGLGSIPGLPEYVRMGMVTESAKNIKKNHYALRSQNSPSEFLLENGVVGEEAIDASLHDFYFHLEGKEFVGDDGNGYAAKFGINQKFHPDIDVSKLSQEQAWSIIKDQYWDEIGVGSMPSEVQPAALALATNIGVGPARNILEKSAYDPDAVKEASFEYYKERIKKNPNKAKYKKSWFRRVNDAYDLGQRFVSGVSDPEALPYVSKARMQQKRNDQELSKQQKQSLREAIEDDLITPTDLKMSLNEGSINESLFNYGMDYMSKYKKETIRQDKMDKAYLEIDNKLSFSDEFKKDADLIYDDLENILAGDQPPSEKVASVGSVLDLTKGYVPKEFGSVLSSMINLGPGIGQSSHGEIVGMIATSAKNSQYQNSYAMLPKDVQLYAQRYDALLKHPEVAGNTGLASERALELMQDKPQFQNAKQEFNVIAPDLRFDDEVGFLESWFTDDLGEVQEGTELYSNMNSDFKKDIEAYMVHGASISEAKEMAYDNLKAFYAINPMGEFMKNPPSVVHGDSVLDVESFNDFISDDIVDVLENDGILKIKKDGESKYYSYTEGNEFAVTFRGSKSLLQGAIAATGITEPDRSGLRKGEFLRGDISIQSDHKTNREFMRYRQAPNNAKPPVTYQLKNTLTGLPIYDNTGNPIRYGVDIEAYKKKLSSEKRDISRAVAATKRLENKSIELGYGEF